VAEIIQLEPGQQMPDFGDDEPRVFVEASGYGGFQGSGWSRKAAGESVFYVSLAEDDATLERATKAAQDWASKYRVRRIWVQASAS
jgi:hypothetical protein